MGGVGGRGGEAFSWNLLCPRFATYALRVQHNREHAVDVRRCPAAAGNRRMDGLMQLQFLQLILIVHGTGWPLLLLGGGQPFFVGLLVLPVTGMQSPAANMWRAGSWQHAKPVAPSCPRVIASAACIRALLTGCRLKGWRQQPHRAGCHSGRGPLQPRSGPAAYDTTTQESIYTTRARESGSAVHSHTCAQAGGPRQQQSASHCTTA
jgi:hypothetical protein